MRSPSSRQLPARMRSASIGPASHGVQLSKVGRQGLEMYDCRDKDLDLLFLAFV